MAFLNLAFQTSPVQPETWTAPGTIKFFGLMADKPSDFPKLSAQPMATFNVRDQRPHAARDFITARYNLCLAMVHQMLEPARTLHFENRIREDRVLLQCYQHLLEGESDLSQLEAAWVVRRMAETLDWDCPGLPAPAFMS